MVLGLIACAGFIPEPGPSHLAWAHTHQLSVRIEELREGRILFVQKCDGCHFLPRLKRIAPKDWSGLMDSMRVEAKLSRREDSLIRTYVTVASGQWIDSLATVSIKKAP